MQISEYCGHDLSGRRDCFFLLWSTFARRNPLFWLSFHFWSVVMNSCFINSCISLKKHTLGFHLNISNTALKWLHISVFSQLWANASAILPIALSYTKAGITHYHMQNISNMFICDVFHISSVAVHKPVGGLSIWFSNLVLKTTIATLLPSMKKHHCVIPILFDFLQAS